MKIMTGRVWIGAECYKPGDEAPLAAALSNADVERLVAKGVLVGDWGQSAPEKKSDAPPSPRAATLKVLKDSGIAPADTVTMTDEEIIDLKGIAESGLKEIRAAYGEYSGN